MRRTFFLPLLLLGALLLPATAFAQGSGTATLSNLVVAGLTPAFSPAVTQYKIPKTSNCSVPVTATLANPAHRLYISGGEVASGTTRNTWICSGSGNITVSILNGWTEVGKYTIVPDPALAPPPPPPPAGYGKLSNLVITGLSPAFSTDVKTYSIPRTGCSVSVTATLANTGNKLYVSGAEVPSGTTRSAWVCDGRTKIDITILQVWTEVGRYTVNVIDAPAPAPTPMPSPSPSPMTPPSPTPAPPPPPPATEPNPVPTPLAPVPGTPLPPASPITLDAAVTFLNQATFGPTAADVAALQASGKDLWLEQQFRMAETTIPDGLDVNALRALVFKNLATAPDQLRQRVAFALGQTLVVSINKNVNGYEVIPWVRLLSNYAFSNYRTLLREVTLSPSMGKFLDLANSTKAAGMSAANENYPRELLQLFSLGLWELNQNGTFKTVGGQPIPTYSQETLREVARALTGWTYPSASGGMSSGSGAESFAGLMQPRPAVHDTGTKAIVNGVVLPANQTVTKDLEDTIDAIFNHPNVPPFVATRLIRSLVTSNPSTAYIKRVADVFVNDGNNVRGDMKAVIKAVLTDPDAAVTGAQDGHLKDPMLHVIGLGRAMGAQVNDPGMFLYIFSTLGQLVLTPPTVFSWYSPLAALPKQPGQPALFGPEFQIYAPAMAIQRANFIYTILSGQTGNSFKVDIAPFVAFAGNPPALVEKVNQTLFFGRMSPELRQILINATQAVASNNTQQRALGALYLAAISGEYAVHTGAP